MLACLALLGLPHPVIYTDLPELSVSLCGSVIRETTDICLQTA